MLPVDATVVAIVLGCRGPVRERIGPVIVVLVLLAIGCAVFGVAQASSPPNR